MRLHGESAISTSCMEDLPPTPENIPFDARKSITSKDLWDIVNLFMSVLWVCYNIFWASCDVTMIQWMEWSTAELLSLLLVPQYFSKVSDTAPCQDANHSSADGLSCWWPPPTSNFRSDGSVWYVSLVFYCNSLGFMHFSLRRGWFFQVSSGLAFVR